MHPMNSQFIRPGDKVALIDGETGEVCTPWVAIPEAGPVEFPPIGRRVHVTGFAVIMRPVKTFPTDRPMWIGAKDPVSLNV